MTTYQVDIPREGLAQPYLMRMIMSLSSFHLAYLNKDKRAHYLLLANKHQILAVRGLRGALTRAVTPQNCHALWVSSIFLAISKFAFTPTYEHHQGSCSSALLNLVNIFSMISGIVAIMRSSQELIRTGPFQGIFSQRLGFQYSRSDLRDLLQNVIIVMEREPDVPGGGRRRPVRKRARTTRAMESEKQERDREWEEEVEEEEESSEGASSRNRPKKRAAPKAVGSMIEAIQGLKQSLQQDFNKKMEIMKAEFQLEFTKLSDRMAQEVTRTTAQMAQELFLVREQLTEARSELEQTRLQLDIMNSAHAVRSSSQTYADAARMTPVSITTQAPSTVRSASPEPVFCTVDTSRVPEDHIGDTTPAVLRRTIEQEMRTSSDQPSWRCVAVTRDGRNTNRLRVIGRNEEELNRIKAIIEAKKAPGARVLRDQLYPVKVDNINRTAVLDHEGKVLPGAMEALGQENEVQIAKMAWLSRKDSVKAYGSMVVYLTKNSDARRLLQERYFHAVGESAYTSVFERRTGPVQCYNCQELGHKAFSCNRNRGVPTGGTVQQQTDRLMSVVLEAIHALTPRAKPSPYAKRWWTTDLTQLRQIYTYWRNRARAERRAGRILPDLEQGAKNAAKQYHDAIRQQKNAHWSEFLANEANIWKVGKYLNPDDSAAFGKVPQLARADGSCTNDSSEQAEELMATFFLLSLPP
ncbi:hypothetical protein ACJ41O_000120 [Fusarium nematophilum]